MGYSDNLVTIPVSVSDVASALGVTSGDVGTLCKHANIRPFAKYKPQSHTAIVGNGDHGELTDTQRSENSWGIVIVNKSSGAAITHKTIDNLDNAVWRYLSRSVYRLLDFKDYNSGAPTHLLCPTSMASLSVNEVNDNHAQYEAISFFVFQAGGHTNYNKDIDGNTVTGLTYCLDLQTLFGGNLYGNSGEQARLGLALYNSSEREWSFLPCRSQFVFVASGATIDNYMTNLDLKYATEHIYPSLSAGSYTAYPCVRVGDETGSSFEYYPMHHRNGLSDEICSIPLTIGGTELYYISLEGVALNATDTPSKAAMTIAGSDIYIFLRVKNNTGVQHNTSTTSSSWTMKGYCSGVFVNRTTEVKETITDIEHSGSEKTPSSFTIENGDSTVICFKLSRIFNKNVTVADNAGSGSWVRITAHLYYNGTEFTNTGSLQTSVITKA